MILQHSHIQDTRDIITSGISNHTLKTNFTYTNNYKLGGIRGVGLYIKDYSTLLTGGMTGNLAVTYMGSYGLKYEILSIDEESGAAEVHFSISNSSTIESATHSPVIGYTQWWSNNIGKPLNSHFSSGPFSPTSQTVDWTEIVQVK